MVATILTATSFAHREHGQRIALYLHVVSWVMQFIGHGVAEGRAPALLDNILGGACHRSQVLHSVLTLLSSCVFSSLLRSSRGVLKVMRGSRSFDDDSLDRCCSSSATVKISTRSSTTTSEMRLPSSGKYRETKHVLLRKTFEGCFQMICSNFLHIP